MSDGGLQPYPSYGIIRNTKITNQKKGSDEFHRSLFNL